MKQKRISSTEEMITEEGLAHSAAKRLEPGTLLFSIFASIGAVGILSISASTNQAIASLKIKDSSVDANYLYHWLKGQEAVTKKAARGVAQSNINLSILRSMVIPVPTKEIQQSIAYRFDLIDEQIDKARQLQARLDNLVKSQFVEMFGDGKLPLKTIGELATDIRYGTSKKASESGRYTYLRMNNITDDGKLNYSDVKRIDLNDDELAKCQVIAGDLLFNRTNSREKVGKTAVFHEETPMIIAGYIIRVRLCPEIFPDYLSTYMNLPTTKKMLRSIAKGAVHQANINSKELAAIEVPVAPIALQEQFLNFIARVDKLGFDVRQQIGNCARLNIDSAHYFDSFAVWRASLLH